MKGNKMYNQNRYVRQKCESTKQNFKNSTHKSRKQKSERRNYHFRKDGYVSKRDSTRKPLRYPKFYFIRKEYTKIYQNLKSKL